jgi:hypothetical protein
MFVEKFRWWFRKLGYEDYHIFVFLSVPFTMIAIYQAMALYYIFGEKSKMKLAYFNLFNFSKFWTS